MHQAVVATLVRGKEGGSAEGRRVAAAAERVEDSDPERVKAEATGAAGWVAVVPVAAGWVGVATEAEAMVEARTEEEVMAAAVMAAAETEAV